MEAIDSPISQAIGRSNEQELHILTEIGQILSSTLELRDAFAKTMQIISDKLNMHRGALVLLDESTGRLRTEAAVGMTAEEILYDFPDLTAEDIQACYAFAAARERRLAVIPYEAAI